MKKNIQIILIFTLIFIAALVVNFIPSKKSSSSDKVLIYSSFAPGRILTKLEESLVKHNMKVGYYEKDDSNANVKLKYSVSVTEEDKKLYDIYSLNKEKVYTITSKGVSREASIEDIKRASESKKEFNDNVVVFSPLAHKFFSEYLNLSDLKAYENNSVWKIVEDDPSITGVLFQHEIDEKYKDTTKLVELKDKDISSANLSICLLVKKQTLDSEALKDIVKSMEKVTND